jgi:hypothetical protein
MTVQSLRVCGTPWSKRRPRRKTRLRSRVMIAIRRGGPRLGRSPDCRRQASWHHSTAPQRPAARPGGQVQPGCVGGTRRTSRADSFSPGQEGSIERACRSPRSIKSVRMGLLRRQSAAPIMLWRQADPSAAPSTPPSGGRPRRETARPTARTPEYAPAENCENPAATRTRRRSA